MMLLFSLRHMFLKNNNDKPKENTKEKQDQQEDQLAVKIDGLKIFETFVF